MLELVDLEAGYASARVLNGVSLTVGEGEVVFVATSLDARWTNWPAHTGSYLSSIQMMLAHLTGKATRGLNKVAGEPLVWAPPEAKKPFEVLTPGGKRVNLGRAVVPAGGTQQSVTLTDTARAGVYRFAVEGDKVRLNFAHAGKGLKSRDGKELTEFEIAGADGKFVPATATIEKGTVVVRAAAVGRPTQVRFGWRNIANPNLANTEGLPATPFRTENWQGGTGE